MESLTQMLTTWQRTTNHALVDDLTYTYDGNRLTGLGESVAGSPGGDVLAQNGADIGVFTYDPNGNMTFDSRKNLSFGYTWALLKKNLSLVDNFLSFANKCLFLTFSCRMFAKCSDC